MKRTKIISLIAAAGILLSAADSHALIGFSVVGGVTHTTPQVKSGGIGMSTTPKTGYLAGAIVDFGLSGRASFEVGALYGIAKYSGTANGVRYTLSLSGVQVPALVRFHPLPLLSFGIGGYYGYRIGQVKVEEVSQPGVTISPGASKTDYGAVGSVRVHLPVGARTTFFVDGRYLYGLKDLDTSSNEYKMRQAQAFAGLRFGI